MWACVSFIHCIARPKAFQAQWFELVGIVVEDCTLTSGNDVPVISLSANGGCRGSISEKLLRGQL